MIPITTTPTPSVSTGLRTFASTLESPPKANLGDYLHWIRYRITVGPDLDRWYAAVMFADAGEEQLAHDILNNLHEKISRMPQAAGRG